MNQRLVRIIKTLHDECASNWRATRDFQMLCQEHDTTFAPGTDCPGRRESLQRGQQVYLPINEADHLVANGYAVYPTHETAPGDSLQETLDRANRAFNQSGLPSVDVEFMEQFRSAVRSQAPVSSSGTVSEHYGGGDPRPARRSRLASSLGVSDEDIAAMKAAIKR